MACAQSGHRLDCSREENTNSYSAIKYWVRMAK
jgi:hypothetical protein